MMRAEIAIVNAIEIVVTILNVMDFIFYNLKIKVL